jgi:hypothetical protein
MRCVEADDRGFFRFVDVLGDEYYLVFAIPPAEGPSMREFTYLGVSASSREIWRGLTLYPHSISGKAPRAASPEALFQLLRLGSPADAIVWTFLAEGSGSFSVSNVPHGHDRVQVSHGAGGMAVRSLPFDIEGGRALVASVNGCLGRLCSSRVCKFVFQCRQAVRGRHQFLRRDAC